MGLEQLHVAMPAKRLHVQVQLPTALQEPLGQVTLHRFCCCAYPSGTKSGEAETPTARNSTAREPLSRAILRSMVMCGVQVKVNAGLR